MAPQYLRRRLPLAVAGACVALAASLTCSLPFLGALDGSLGPDPWFLERVILLPVDLPPGIALTTMSTDHGDIIQLANRTDTPLYVIGQPDAVHFYEGEAVSSLPPLQPVGFSLPEGTEPLLMAVSGRCFEWAPIQPNPDGTYEWDWRLIESPLTNACSIIAGGTGLYVLGGRVAEYYGHSAYGGVRPEDVRVPGATSTSFTVIQDSRAIQVPVVVYSVLNPGFTPEPSPQH